MTDYPETIEDPKSGITYIVRTSLSDPNYKNDDNKKGPELLKDIEEVYVFIPTSRNNILVYFFSRFNFGKKVWSILQDEASLIRL
jgi:hypothetical protein